MLKIRGVVLAKYPKGDSRGSRWFTESMYNSYKIQGGLDVSFQTDKMPGEKTWKTSLSWPMRIFSFIFIFCILHWTCRIWKWGSPGGSAACHLSLCSSHLNQVLHSVTALLENNWDFHPTTHFCNAKHRCTRAPTSSSSTCAKHLLYPESYILVNKLWRNRTFVFKKF